VTAAAATRADQRAVLYAERDLIERRQWTDMCRLDEIRAALAELVDEPRDG
jgi:hypothetical protein